VWVSKEGRPDTLANNCEVDTGPRKGVCLMPFPIEGAAQVAAGKSEEGKKSSKERLTTDPQAS
jgi:hypothetical protein